MSIQPGSNILIPDFRTRVVEILGLHWDARDDQVLDELVRLKNRNPLDIFNSEVRITLPREDDIPG